MLKMIVLSSALTLSMAAGAFAQATTSEMTNGGAMKKDGCPVAATAGAIDNVDCNDNTGSVVVQPKAAVNSMNSGAEPSNKASDCPVEATAGAVDNVNCQK